MSDIIELISKGGWLMAPILACSVIGLAFFLERLWNLQRTKILPARFLDVVSRLLQEGRFEDAEALCNENDSPVAVVLGAGIRYAGRERGLIKEVMEEAGRQEVFYLERFTNALGSIATIAPLLGLLGTVIGMIRMFQNVVNSAEASQAMVDIGLLATGIWQALTTTAAGLTVAIPVYLAYRYVLSRVDRYAVEIEDIGLRAVEMLVDEAQSPHRRAASLTGAPSGGGARQVEDLEGDEDEADDEDSIGASEALTSAEA